MATLRAHQERAPSSLLAARPDVPRAIDAAYQKMMAKKPVDRPASMSDVVERLESCRTFAGRADEARSGRKATAESVAVKPVAPGETVRDSYFHLDDPASPRLNRDRALDDRDPERLTATVARTLEEPALIPDRTGSARPHERAKAKALAFALGALRADGDPEPGLRAVPTHCRQAAGQSRRRLGTRKLIARQAGRETLADRANAAANRAAIVLDVLMW